MEGINSKYNIELEVITPLSIGAGSEKDWVNGIDFITRGNTLYKLNLGKMAEKGIDMNKLSTYYSKKDSNGIYQLIGNKLDAVSDFRTELPFNSGNDIKSFLKNQLSGRPVVAGSSIKGSIRSILFDNLRDNEREENKVFGNSKDGDEFMRFVKISDIEFLENKIVNSKIFNLHKGENQKWEGGWKHTFSNTTSSYQPRGFNTFYESIVPHQKSTGVIMLSETAFDLFGENNQKKGSRKKKLFSIKDLFKIINSHTKEYLKKEKEFFERYQADKTDLIIASIDNLINYIPDDNSYCIFKMSAGSGFHSITGDWQFDDYSDGRLDRKRGGNLPKSRKIAVYGDSFSLMGFVKMRILTEGEIREKERLLKEKRESDNKENEAMRMLVLEREKRIAQEKQNEKLYNSTIIMAEDLFSNHDYENALLEFIKASELLPNGKKHESRISTIHIEIERIKKEKEIQNIIDRAKQEADEQRRQKIEGGLSCLDEKYEIGPKTGEYKVADFKIVKSKIDDWLKKSQNASLPDNQIIILKNTLERIHSSFTKDRDKKPWSDISDGIWKDVARWIGEEKAKLLFGEIIK